MITKPIQNCLKIRRDAALDESLSSKSRHAVQQTQINTAHIIIPKQTQFSFGNWKKISHMSPIWQSKEI